MANTLLQDEAIGHEQPARDLEQAQPPLVAVWAVFKHGAEREDEQHQEAPGAEAQVVDGVYAAQHDELSARRGHRHRGDEEAEYAKRSV